jgi:hypothetical protein
LCLDLTAARAQPKAVPFSLARVPPQHTLVNSSSMQAEASRQLTALTQLVRPALPPPLSLSPCTVRADACAAQAATESGGTVLGVVIASLAALGRARDEWLPAVIPTLTGVCLCVWVRVGVLTGGGSAAQQGRVAAQGRALQCAARPAHGHPQHHEVRLLLTAPQPHGD